MLDQRRPLVPGRVGRRRGDIVALEPRNRDRGEIRDADLARKGAVSEGNAVENAFVVADEVHLVHREHEMPDTAQMREEAVAARLGQYALARLDKDHRNIGGRTRGDERSGGTDGVRT